MVLLMMGCIEKNYTPKPEGYPRISLPERSGYQQFERDDCPFTFEYPSYSQVVKDTSYFDSIPPDPCWFNIVLNTLNGKIYMSYKPLTKEERNLEQVLTESHALTFKHTVKAEYIDQKRIRNPDTDVHGIYYKVGGDAASAIQFFLTDSTRYFIRGSLYFRNPPNSDSLRPVVNFVEKDINHLIKTFRWQSAPS
jgi:gliding motility-associated lipoprotein GldD